MKNLDIFDYNLENIIFFVYLKLLYNISNTLLHYLVLSPIMSTIQFAPITTQLFFALHEYYLFLNISLFKAFT